MLHMGGIKFCSFKLLLKDQKKAEGLKLNPTVYTFLSLEPNVGTGF